MTAERLHLAQLNVGRMAAPTTAPEVADFMAAPGPSPSPSEPRRRSDVRSLLIASPESSTNGPIPPFARRFEQLALNLSPERPSTRRNEQSVLVDRAAVREVTGPCDRSAYVRVGRVGRVANGSVRESSGGSASARACVEVSPLPQLHAGALTICAAR